MFARKAMSLLCLLVLLFPVAIAGCGPTTRGDRGPRAGEREAASRPATCRRKPGSAKKRCESAKKRPGRRPDKGRGGAPREDRGGHIGCCQAESQNRPDVALGVSLKP